MNERIEVSSRTRPSPRGSLPGVAARQEVPTRPIRLYDAEVVRVMAAADTVQRPLRAARFRTLIGSLACTGLRIGEAFGLDRGEVALAAGVLTVRETKLGKSRAVLLHPSTVHVLIECAELRERLCSQPTAPSFVLATHGTRPNHPTICQPFHELVKQTGIMLPAGRSVRVHDLRHRFAVTKLLGWCRNGDDVQARMPAA